MYIFLSLDQPPSCYYYITVYLARNFWDSPHVFFSTLAIFCFKLIIILTVITYHRYFHFDDQKTFHLGANPKMH